jgi:hypothetical protein
MTQNNQAQFLDKLAKSGSDNDEEMVSLISDKIQAFDKKIETERISIQRNFEKLTKELNIDHLIEKLEQKLNINVYERFKDV